MKGAPSTYPNISSRSGNHKTVQLLGIGPHYDHTNPQTRKSQKDGRLHKKAPDQGRIVVFALSKWTQYFSECRQNRKVIWHRLKRIWPPMWDRGASKCSGRDLSTELVRSVECVHLTTSTKRRDKANSQA